MRSGKCFTYSKVKWVESQIAIPPMYVHVVGAPTTNLLLSSGKSCSSSCMMQTGTSWGLQSCWLTFTMKFCCNSVRQIEGKSMVTAFGWLHHHSRYIFCHALMYIFINVNCAINYSLDSKNSWYSSFIFPSSIYVCKWSLMCDAFGATLIQSAWYTLLQWKWEGNRRRVDRPQVSPWVHGGLLHNIELILTS